LQKVLSLAGDGQTLRCLLTSGDLIDARELPSGVSQLRKPVDAERLCRWLANDPGPVAGMPDSTVPDALHKPICRSEVYVATGSSGASPVATYTSLLQQRRGSWPVGIFGTEKGTRADRAAIALLDDTAALPRLGGNRGALQSLRAMLLAELRDSAPWRQQLRLSTPPPAAIDALHRLRAACALTGCARLGQLGESIEAGLRSGTSTPAAALEDLDKVVADTISAISAQIE
jgi:HPt (histidine-containing phosphotransfer) domain-containing protein